MPRKRQRNDIFEHLESVGVNLDGYKLLDPSHQLVLDQGVAQVTVRHDATSSYFTFWPAALAEYDWRVQGEVGGATWTRTALESWKDLMRQLIFWAEEVKYEMEHPDLWTELERVPEILAAAQGQDAGNTPFTPAEQAEIASSLDQAKEFVHRDDAGLTTTQMAAIEQRLDEIKEASKRVGRKDWVMLANGALLSLIVNDVVPASVVHGIFSMVITGIGHIFGVGGPAPIISA